MENNEIKENIIIFKKAPYKLKQNDINKYSVETLELMAINIYKEYLLHGFDKKILDIILRERARKLNEQFEWTKNNKETFLKVSDKLTQVFVKAYNEAITTAKELENRILKSDAFLLDYEIEIKISLYMKDKLYYDDNDWIGFVLSEPLMDYSPINYSFGHSHFKYELSNKPVF